MSPDDRHLYVTSIADDSLVVLAPEFWRFSGRANGEWDGTLHLVQTFQDTNPSQSRSVAERDESKPIDGAEFVDGLCTPRGVIVSRDGRFLYVAGSGEDAIAVFQRDAATGKLTLSHRPKDQEPSECGLTGISCVCFSPDGRHVYTAPLKFSVAAFVVKPQ